MVGTSSVSQEVGPDPLMGRRHLLLGRQNLCFSTMNVKNGSPNCVIFCFVGRQLPNVENHCSRQSPHLVSCRKDMFELFVLA